MKELLTPIKSESLVDVFISRFEDLILSGKLSIGEKLPSERELALQLGVSRPVVHEGLLDLASKGLVSIIPRVGTVVNDYRKEGSLALLTSLVNYHNGRLEPNIFESMLRMRFLFEMETARLAARNRTEEQLEEFNDILREEEAVDRFNTERIAEIDFTFHHLIAMSTGNMIYPLLINSFKQVYINLTSQFFTMTELVSQVFSFHRDLVSAIGQQDEEQAMTVMKNMLDHGESFLKTMMDNDL